jgi:hypothetical protein
MNEERKKILNMLSEEKITVEEAEKLLTALDSRKLVSSQTDTPTGLRRKVPSFLCVKVEPKEEHGRSDKVNVKVPLALVKAGIKLTSFIPEEARAKIDHAMEEKGVKFSVSDLSGKNIDGILEALGDLSVDVDSKEAIVRVYCE